ncbi:MAG TPA: TRAM domain-containing protein [Syntrophobacteraceae bacterium]|nr:TRAM domain-containing protein [Syntrophobacteraceae bacterium]
MKWAWLILKVLLFAVCGFGGYLIAHDMESLSQFEWASWAGMLAGMLFATVALSMEKLFKHMPLKVIIGGTLGLVLGLSVAKLVGYAFTGLENSTVRIAVYIILSCIFGYVGIVLGTIKVDEMRLPNWSWIMRGGQRGGQSSEILDTSVIIDGRIADIVETGFLSGTLIIPEFVLQELQHIADSPDPIRRVRGRRGLDIIKRLQQEKTVEVRIDRQDFGNLSDVDAKLVALALRLNAKIVTNDYNLSKVAEVQGIRVLNINQLANALKPVVLPGEVLRLQILKEGKEQGQGIAYLEDGTMVVVENASRHLGREVEVSVTSILQTTAGRLIFTTLKDSDHTRHQH